MKLYGYWRFDPAYRKVNPQAVVPALILDDGGAPLVQSMAILEYLEDTHPEPALLPAGARERARVRGLAQICVSDGHPFIVPRIRRYLELELKADEAARTRWLQHWSLKALEAVESHLASERDTGRFCHGDAPTLADVCVASQVIAARDCSQCDVSSVPTVMRIYGECMKLDAFARSHPQRQPGAPTDLTAR